MNYEEIEKGDIMKYTVLDNSKNSDVSWNETTYHCTIYVIL